MRISTLSNEDVPEGYERKVIGPPIGHPIDGDIRACEMATKLYPEQGYRVFRAKFVLEDGDIEILQEGIPIWVSFYGVVVPFDCDIGYLKD